MQSTVKGRLRNLNLPYSHALVPVYEAIVNAIQSIETQADPGEIKVRILREAETNDSQKKLKIQDLPIIGFAIEDNGQGFTAENFQAFTTLDTTHKIQIGGRGIGRLTWLKAFEKVSVNSTFSENEQWSTLAFEFDEDNEISQEERRVC